MRKTKIICTIGPACTDEKILTDMCLAGMNVARLNFSHGSHAEHSERIALLKKVREKLHYPLAILLDTKGPEYRIGKFADGSVRIDDGATFTFTTEDLPGDGTRVSVSYAGLPGEMEKGDRILVSNGLLVFEVEKTTATEVICRTLAGGRLSDRKSMSFPGKTLGLPYLSEQDKEDLLFAVREGVDFIACSFVSRRQDLLDVKAFLAANGGEDIELIAKLENQAGIDNLEQICAECDGIMIGRGDMGVELPIEELPVVQKEIITKCRLLGKRVITATEMLESMIQNPRPTRAEVSDVANAVYDGTSAIMLSGETAAGKYPVQTVETMSRIAERSENSIAYEGRFSRRDFKIKNTVDAISHATCGVAADISASAIAVCTLSGMTARMVSRFRPAMDIVGLTVDERIWRRLSLSWGVIPALCERFDSTDVLFYEAKRQTAALLGLSGGDRIVITGGLTRGVSGNTNLIKVETI